MAGVRVGPYVLEVGADCRSFTRFAAKREDENASALAQAFAEEGEQDDVAARRGARGARSERGSRHGQDRARARVVPGRARRSLRSCIRDARDRRVARAVGAARPRRALRRAAPARAGAARAPRHDVPLARPDPHAPPRAPVGEGRERPGRAGVGAARARHAPPLCGAREEGGAAVPGSASDRAATRGHWLVRDPPRPRLRPSRSFLAQGPGGQGDRRSRGRRRGHGRRGHRGRSCAEP